MTSTDILKLSISFLIICIALGGCMVSYEYTTKINAEYSQRDTTSGGE